MQSFSADSNTGSIPIVYVESSWMTWKRNSNIVTQYHKSMYNHHGWTSKQTEISWHNITSLCTIIMDGLEKQTEISLNNITSLCTIIMDGLQNKLKYRYTISQVYVQSSWMDLKNKLKYRYTISHCLQTLHTSLHCSLIACTYVITIWIHLTQNIYSTLQFLQFFFAHFKYFTNVYILLHCSIHNSIHTLTSLFSLYWADKL